MNILVIMFNNENEITSKSLDPYEDSVLIDYLKKIRSLTME